MYSIRMKKVRGSLAVIISLAMIIACVAMVVNEVDAEDSSSTTPSVKEVSTYDELVAELEGGNDVKLMGNITAIGEINGTNVSIDLNQKTLTLKVGGTNFFGDSSISNGKIDISGCLASGDCIIGIGDYSNSAELTLDNVDIIGDGYSSAYAVLYIYNSGTLNINGGSIVVSNDSAGAGGVIKAHSAANGKVNIKGTSAAPVKLEFTNAKIGFLDGTVLFDYVDLDINGGANAINQSLLTVKNSDLMIKDCNGRALTLSQGNVTIINSNLNFSGASEGEIRFKKSLDLTFDKDSTISECTIYADSSATGSNVNGTPVTGTEESPSKVVVNEGVASVDGKSSPVYITKGNEIIGYSNLNDAMDAAVSGDVVEIKTDSTTTKKITIIDGVTLIVSEEATLNMGSFDIEIVGFTKQTSGNGGELIVYGSVVGTGIIDVYGSLYLESADVRMSVDIHDDEGEEGYVSISKPKKMTVTGNQTADLGVGYGNTLVLKDLDVPSGKYIKAWGTVVIEGTVTVEDSNGFIVYYGGNAQIDGALVIEGGATVNGTAVINGSVKVYDSEGGASFNVGATGVVDVLGTMDVLKGKAKETTNTLAVAAGGDLNVEGTLTVTGTMSGMVCDMGTVVFNGAASGADTGFTVYDGVTLTIASVTGTLKITDLNIQDKDYTGPNYVISTGNVVSISNVKNVTVSVVLDETSVKENNVSKRLVTSEMTVTGTITSIDEETTTVVEKVEVTGTSDKHDVNNEIVQGSIVLGDITLGKQVVLDIKSGDVDINGTVNAVAEKSSIIIGDDAVDVNGTILVGEKAVAATVLNINGATYYIDDDAESDDKVTYYTTFENALAAVATAYDNEVTVLGEVEVATALEIPADATILFAEKAKMTIDVDGTVTVAVGALFDASKAEKVDVDGMLIIMDKESGLEGDNKLVYQVYTEAGDVATYSGLVLALRNATEGDVITVVKAGEIEKSVTIPEGVTLVVPNGSTLTIGSEKDDVTLTVAGTLKVEGTVEAADDAQEVEIAVPGTIMEIGSGDIVFADDTTGDVEIIIDDYVTFNTKVDGRATVVYSNLAYAAENATEGDVTVFGDVSAGDVTFTMGEKATGMTIKFDANSTDSTMTIGTMTLVSNGKANIVLATAKGAVTGTIAAAAGSVDLNKVSGITIAVSIVTDVDGSTDYMTVDETLAGSMTVATGTITVDELSVGSTEKNVLTIDTDATLVIPSGKKLTVSAMDLITAGVTQYYGLIVDGTLAIEGGSLNDTPYSHDDTDNDGVVDDGETVVLASEIIVNGTMTVSKTTAADIDGKLAVNGTLSVISTDEEKAKLTVNGVIVLGTAPALGANGVLSGPISVANSSAAYIVAYAGADVSAALLNVNDSTGESDIDSTEIVINGVPYMTVYVNNDNLVSLKDLEDAKYFKTDGFENDVTWASPAEDTTKVGVFDKVEGTMLAAKTKLTVSAGVGLKVYIDGLAIENFKGEYNDVEGYWIQFGTHTVSFAVESGYDGANATITVNGVAVSNNGTFTVDVDDKEVVIIASGAVPAQSSGSTVIVDDADDGMALTDILLIVLVVLIVIMAIIVALRMMRS